MKTPKQKAIELVDKFHYDIDYDLVGAPSTKIMVAKQCALIAADEMQLIMDSLWKIQGTNEGQKSSYLEEVKKEIEKL